MHLTSRPRFLIASFRSSRRWYTHTLRLDQSCFCWGTKTLSSLSEKTLLPVLALSLSEKTLLPEMVVLSETPLLVLPVLAFDLDDTLWDTAATLGAAHAAMAAAAPALLEEHRSPDGFVKEMLATMATHPDQKHDFTFLRKTTLLRLLGCERSAEESYTKWFAVRNQPCFFPGAIEALRRLQESGFRLCAISDGNSRPMDIAELSGVFEFAVTLVCSSFWLKCFSSNLSSNSQSLCFAQVFFFKFVFEFTVTWVCLRRFF
ncbi:unnamed protein product [Polarella glacialis]|uniref:Uncharacterized protein n=1 Tax=Polarella glacialis TaxID=89957 RepID=A0A813FLA1_POLGL|nr:unnamed protein product [Polarella glacialis]